MGNLFLGAAGICDGELNWSMDLADGAGNGKVRKPGIRAMETLRKRSQALGYTSPAFGLTPPAHGNTMNPTSESVS